MNKAYLLLGGNIGDKNKNLKTAVEYIEKSIGKIVLRSSVYETAPWGFSHEDFFLNQSLLVATIKNPEELLQEILKIETAMGRKRGSEQWSSRIIDIDILFFNDIILETSDLKIPHPHLHKRKFTLLPLNEIAENFLHPVFKKSVSSLLSECEDELYVRQC